MRVPIKHQSLSSCHLHDISTGYKVIHNPVHNLSRTFHNMRYPLKHGITFSKG